MDGNQGTLKPEAELLETISRLLVAAVRDRRAARTAEKIGAASAPLQRENEL